MADLPPLSLPEPTTARRRMEKPAFPPFDPARLQVRGATAAVLEKSVKKLSASIESMTEDQRKAVFFKLEHEGPFPLGGTGLQALGEPGSFVTLAVPREDNLDRFEKKIQDFGTAPLKRGRPLNPEVDRLKAIGQGEPTDRLSDSLFSQYAKLVKKQYLICEIEIVSLLNGERKRREEIAQILEELQKSFNAGVHGNLFEHETIKGTCRAVIRCSGLLFKRLVEDGNWQRKIVWFEERPHFQTFHEIQRDFKVEDLGELEPPPKDAPVVCIVDSGVTPQNPFLKPVSRISLFKSFLRSDPDNPYDGCGHGSGVASLAAYNVLNIAAGSTNAGRVWIASARILNDDNQLEDDRLFSVLLREVVEFFRPKGVRIFNLSVADPSRKWNETSRRTAPRKSWVARTIDRLSREHDVIFVTCTGNILSGDVSAYLRNGEEYPDYFCSDSARILDPGQAALALTVGSIAPGTMITVSSDTAIALEHHPSPFTRTGPGIRSEIKPELVDYGGNLGRNAAGDRATPNPGLNVVMATHQITPAITHSFGTSFAAPRVTHKLALVMHRLQSLGVKSPSSALLKAVLVNSAMYRNRPGDLDPLIDELDAQQKDHWLNLMGYGFCDAARAGYCETHSSILYYQGLLARNEIAFFQVPVPAVLVGSGQSKKRLTVSVVFSPEVQRWGLESYLGTLVKWRMFRGDALRDEIITAMSREDEATNGTDDTDEETANDSGKKAPKELAFELGLRARSRGTVQHAVFTWARHKEAYSQGPYTLAVTAYEKWARNNPPQLPYAVVVRLEDSSRGVRVYSEVKALLAKVKVPVSR